MIHELIFRNLLKKDVKQLFYCAMTFAFLYLQLKHALFTPTTWNCMKIKCFSSWVLTLKYFGANMTEITQRITGYELDAVSDCF